LRSADLVFANLECLLYEPPDGTVEHEGFSPTPKSPARPCRPAASPRSASPTTSLRRGGDLSLDRAARPDRHSPCRRRRRPRTARSPAIIERGGLRVFPAAQLDYWPTNHEASAHGAHRDPATRLPGASAQDPPGNPANEPPRRAADRRHLGRSRIPCRLCRRHRRVAPRRGPRRLMPWGSAKRCSTT
jgi:hypothetical protein